VKQKIDLHPNIDSISYIGPDGEHGVIGKSQGRYRLASITKLLTTYVVADAVVGGFVGFEDLVASPQLKSPDVTLQDLLSHSSGIRPDELQSIDRHKKRIYTNEAFDLAGEFLISKLGKDFKETTIGNLFEDGLNSFLGASFNFEGTCSASATGTLEDLILLMNEMRNPTYLDFQTHKFLTTPFLPELEGILPGWGNFKRNTFGVGFEIRGNKQPHWTGSVSSPETFGHFGQSGAFIFHDPIKNVSACCLTNQDFSGWAKEEFPKLSNLIYEVCGLSQIK
jgi:CubicO group peptidase (beta-lactamase class C family)